MENTIKIPMFHRRLLKEKELLLLQYPTSNLTLYDDSAIIEIIINRITVRLKFPREYPFKLPICNLNNTSYLHYLKNKSNICLCCSSLLCNYNWKVSMTSCDILNEISKNIRDKQNSSYLKLIKKIKEKYLISDIPIEEYI